MNNVMSIEGQPAVISFDPDLNQFRGEFTGLNGGADFYANNVDELREEGVRSLKTFLVVCQERGIEPYKNFSGRFVVRLPASLHAQLTNAASAAGVSLNQWVRQTLEREVRV